MRAPISIAALALASSLSACGGLAGGGETAGPPEWFLRDHERQQMAAIQATAGGMRFAVATEQPAGVYRERVAGLIENCWIDGEAGWRLQRGANGQDLTLISAPQAAGQPAQETIRVSVIKAAGPGLEVRASGPLATDDQRDRLRRSFERAKSFNPSAPHCPNVADAGTGSDA